MPTYDAARHRAAGAACRGDWRRDATEHLSIRPRRRSRSTRSGPAAFESNLKHYADVFCNGTVSYAIPKGALTDPSGCASWRRSSSGPRGRHPRIARTTPSLHQQLAARTAGRQPAYGRNRASDRRQHHHAAGGHLGMVWWYASQPRGPEGVRLPKRIPCGTWEATPSQRATVKYLLGRVGPDSWCRCSGRGDGPLRRRGRRVLRLSLVAVAALQRDSHLARPDGPVLDRHRLAGGRIVHRPARQRARTDGPTTRRQRAVRGPAGRRGAVAGRGVAEHPQQAVRRRVVLPRSPGLRVRRPGTGLANRPVRRAAALAVPGGAFDPRRPFEDPASRSSYCICSLCRPGPSACSTVSG